MKNTFEQFVKAAQEIQLTSAEKTAMLSRLESHMNKPVVEVHTARSWSLGFAGFLLRPWPVAFAIVVLLCTATVSFAQHSLPGEPLYAVKVNVNEQVLGFFAVSEQARAQLEVKLAAERLEEIEKLAIAGKWEPQALAAAQANFEKHSDKIEERVKKYENEQDYKAAAKVASDYESSLRAHNEVLSIMSQQESTTTSVQVNSVLQQVQAKGEQATKSRSEAEDKVAAKQQNRGKGPAQTALTAAERSLADARKYREKNKLKLLGQGTETVDVKLDVSQNLLSQAKARFEAEEFSQSLSLARESQRSSQEVQKFMELTVTLNKKTSPAVKGETIQKPQPEIKDTQEGDRPGQKEDSSERKDKEESSKKWERRSQNNPKERQVPVQEVFKKVDVQKK